MVVAPSNVPSGVAGLIPEPVWLSMETFDDLPPRLRRRLANATLNFSPRRAAALLKQYQRRPFRLPRNAAVDAVCDCIAAMEEELAIGPLPKRRGEP